MSDDEIYDILGVVEECRSSELTEQFRELLKNGCHPMQIWLGCDYGVFVQGKILARTADLIAVKA